jgi:hypothetical protein
MLKKGCTKELLDVKIPICGLCHSTIHRFFTNIELAENYNTIEKLLANEKFYKYARWASGLADSRYASKMNP